MTPADLHVMDDGAGGIRVKGMTDAGRALVKKYLNWGPEHAWGPPHEYLSFGCTGAPPFLAAAELAGLKILRER